MTIIMLFVLIFLTLTIIRWRDAVEMSPYPILPSFHNMVLDGQIYLNPFTWDEEVLVHEIAHIIRGKGPRDGRYEDPDHDPEFWKTYDVLMKKYGLK